MGEKDRSPPWVHVARDICREHLEEWRIPGTENIVAVVSYNLMSTDGQELVREPTLVKSGWAEGVHEDVKAAFRPIHQHISRENHSERVLILELVEAARTEFGDDCLEGL